jgi:hypothetical protein
LLCCPDWSRLAAARSDEGAEPEGWAEAVSHFDSCALCRKEALKADPLLVFRRMPAVEITPAEEHLEVESMQQAVAAMRTARRLEVRSEARGRFAGWRRWAAAAVLAGISLGVGGDIGPSRAPQLEPVLDGIDRPEARVYEVGDDEFSAVMVIDESYESLDV